MKFIKLLFQTVGTIACLGGGIAIFVMMSIHGNASFPPVAAALFLIGCGIACAIWMGFTVVEIKDDIQTVKMRPILEVRKREEEERRRAEITRRQEEIARMPFAKKASFTEIYGGLRLDEYLRDDEQTITIPATVEGKAILEISDRAFKGLTAIRTVVIPEGVTSIGQEAFSKSSVTSVVFPSTLKRIGKECFAGSRLSSFDLRNTSIKSIPDHCFAKCPIAKGFLPDSIEDIGPYAFDKTGITSLTLPRKLKTINVGLLSDGLQHIYVANGVEALPPHFLVDNPHKFVVHIPESVTKIASNFIVRNSAVKSEWHGPYGWGYRSVEIKNSGCSIAGKQGSYASIFARKNEIPFIPE